MERTKDVHKIHTLKLKKGSWRGMLNFVTLIQQQYFKTRRINVIIYRYFIDQTTRKRRKIFKFSGNESQRVNLNQKRELQKCNETLMPPAVTATTSNFTLGIIEACGENKRCS